MKTRKLLATALLLIGAQTLMAQDHVTNIHAVQNDKMVTITYDGEKTTPEKLIQSFSKFGYKATEVKKQNPEPKKDK